MALHTILIPVGLAAVLLAQPAQACSTPTPEVTLGHTHSHWQEHSDTGVLLLRERGGLDRLDLALQTDCGAWQTELDLTHAQGHRAYQGQSSTGEPVQTTTALQSWAGAAQLWMPWSASWSAGLRADARVLHRDLASAFAASGPVQGYPERYTQSSLAAGLQFAHDSGSSGRWQWRAWQGHGLSGRVRVALPGLDPTVLPLGSARWWGAQLRWSGCRSTWAPGWQCLLLLDHQAERMARGSDTPVYLHGTVRSLAYQPGTRQHNMSLSLGVSYRLP